MSDAAELYLLACRIKDTVLSKSPEIYRYQVSIHWEKGAALATPPRELRDNLIMYCRRARDTGQARSEINALTIYCDARRMLGQVHSVNFAMASVDILKQRLLDQR